LLPYVQLLLNLSIQLLLGKVSLSRRPPVSFEPLLFLCLLYCTLLVFFFFFFFYLFSVGFCSSSPSDLSTPPSQAEAAQEEETACNFL